MRNFKAYELEIIQRCLWQYNDVLIKRIDSTCEGDVLKKVMRSEREKVMTILRDIVDELVKD